MVTRVRWMAALAAVMLCLSMPAWSAPENGWWWNPAENGRGFFLEWQGDQLFIAGYFYEADGRATWMFSGGTMSGPNAFAGRLWAVRGGQTLVGDYVPPASFTDVGELRLEFIAPDVGTLTWPGGVVPIQRHVFGTGDPPFQPKGWWWNPDENGRGFSIDVQGDTLFMAGFMYDTAGNPVWYISSGKLSSPKSFSGTLLQVSGGQTIGGPYRPPASFVAVGTVSIDFTSTETGVLTLTNEPPATAAPAGTSLKAQRRINVRRQMNPRPQAPRQLGYEGRMSRSYYTPSSETTEFTESRDVVWTRVTGDNEVIARYRLISGTAVFAVNGKVPNAPGCTLSGETVVSLVGADAEITIKPWGEYEGYIIKEHQQAYFSVTCQGNSALLPWPFDIELVMRGTIATNDLLADSMRIPAAAPSNLIYEWRLAPYSP